MYSLWYRSSWFLSLYWPDNSISLFFLLTRRENSSYSIVHEITSCQNKYFRPLDFFRKKKGRDRWKVVKNSRFRRQTVCTVFINLLDWSKPRLSVDPVDLDWASYLAIVNVNGRQCNIESSALCSLRALLHCYSNRMKARYSFPFATCAILNHRALRTRSKWSKKMIYASRTRPLFPFLTIKLWIYV